MDYVHEQTPFGADDLFDIDIPDEAHPGEINNNGRGGGFLQADYGQLEQPDEVPALPKPARSLTPAQERRLLVFLDDQFLQLQRNMTRRSIAEILTGTIEHH